MKKSKQTKDPVNYTYKKNSNDKQRHPPTLYSINDKKYIYIKMHCMTRSFTCTMIVFWLPVFTLNWSNALDNFGTSSRMACFSASSSSLREQFDKSSTGSPLLKL